MEKLKLGIIGCGGMMSGHVKDVDKSKVEITACADIVLENAQKMLEVAPNAYVTTDYKTIVDYVDAVLVALPHDLHYECGVFFARNKKHVLMEKPLCNTEAECNRLIEICEEEGVVLMCAYPVPFFPYIQKLKEIVDSGEFGKVMQMSIWTEQWTQMAETHWANTARLGGGQLFSHGCHYIDLLLWFLGEPVKGTHLGTNVGTPWMIGGEGTSIVSLKFKSGALGYHGATWGARGTCMGTQYQIMTEKGMIAFDTGWGEIRLYAQYQPHEIGTDVDKDYKILWNGGGPQYKDTNHEIMHFMDCIQNNKKPMTDGKRAIKSLQVIWRLYDAEKNDVVADLRGLGFEE